MINKLEMQELKKKLISENNRRKVINKDSNNKLRLKEHRIMKDLRNHGEPICSNGQEEI